jgi:hypothetical protein
MSKPLPYVRTNGPRLGQRIVAAVAVILSIAALVMALVQGQGSDETVYGLGWIGALITLLPASIAGLAGVLYWRSNRVFDRRRGWTPN